MVADSVGNERASDGEQAARRHSGAGWSLGKRSSQTAWLGAKLAISMAFAGALGFVAWQQSGAWFHDAARQRVSDRWAELRVCLLGDGRASATRPSARLHAMSLGDGDEAWPSRCEPYARQLDDELARRSMREQLGALPSAVAIVERLDGPQLDALYDGLEAADLPTPQTQLKPPPAPEPVAVLLGGRALSVLASGRQPLELTFDPTDGQRLRMLFGGDAPRLCELAGGPEKERWQRASCRELALSGGDGIALRLARAESGAPDVLFQRPAKGADGFYDAASGIRLWRPHDAKAQAMVLADGTTTVLYTRRKRDGAIDGHRLTQLRPGRAPASRRLSIPDDASLLLMPDALLWWSSEGKRDAIHARKLRRQERWVGPRYDVGKLPAGSRHVADCASGYTQAVLFTSGNSPPRHTLLFREQGMFNKTVDVGVLAGEPTLSCHGDRAIVTRRRGASLTLLSCSSNGCRQHESGELPGFADGLAAVAPLGDEDGSLALVWSEPGEPLRLRIGSVEALATSSDRVLFDSAAHGGIDARKLELVSSDGMALLLLTATDGKLHPVRIDSAGNASAVTVK